VEGVNKPFVDTIFTFNIDFAARVKQHANNRSTILLYSKMQNGEI